MAERAASAQVTQIGVEAVSGTASPADKRLSSIGFGLTPNLETRLIKPAGSKYPTLAVLGRDWTALSVAGDGSYDDLGFIARSALCVPVDGAVGHFIFKPEVAGPDTVDTFTVEKGEPAPGLVDRVPGVQMNELSLAFSREAIEVSGAAIGKAIIFEDDQTATPTALPLVPMMPEDVCVFIDPTSGALGTTKMLRVLNASWGIGGRFNPLFVLDCAQESYVALVEAEPEITVTMMVEADDQGNDLVTDYARAGAKGYVRIECIKDATNGLLIDTCASLTAAGERGDQDGVYAYELTWTGVADYAWDSGTIAKWDLACATDLNA
jgi:hypothetical protein